MAIYCSTLPQFTYKIWTLQGISSPCGHYIILLYNLSFSIYCQATDPCPVTWDATHRWIYSSQLHDGEYCCVCKHTSRNDDFALTATEFALIALNETALDRENHFQVNKTLATVPTSQMYSLAWMLKVWRVIFPSQHLLLASFNWNSRQSSHRRLGLWSLQNRPT